MVIRIYGLELRRSIQETLSDIYYKIYYCDVIASGVYQLQGKITVQVDANATRDHLGSAGCQFWWGATLSQL